MSAVTEADIDPRLPAPARLPATGTGAVVILPTYNEIDNIDSLVDRILSQPGIRAVVVVDDGSPDGTGQAADVLAARHSGRMAVIHRGRKLGLGTAYGAGFRAALAVGAEHVITMDADFSHDPAVLPLLLAAAADADLVIGSRYTAGGSIDGDWGWHRRFLSAGANGLSRRVIGLKADDCTSGFRCYRGSLLGRIGLADIRSSGYSYLIEMLFRCQRAGARVAEVPIRFADRRHGASKISRAEIVRAAETVLRLAWRRWRTRTRLRVPPRPPGGTSRG